MTPEVLAPALQTPGLPWLVLAAFAAGLVRGFSGFGSGLVFLPLAAQWLGPVAAITALAVADSLAPMPLLRRALRDVYLPDLARLLVGLAIGLPLGVWLLLLLDPTQFRYGVSLLALAMLGCLMTGLRYRGRLTPPLVLVTGGASGLLGGGAGLPGPPIILLYLASGLPAAVVRATTLVFLFSYDILLLGLFAVNGRLAGGALGLGLVLAVPTVLGTLTGAALFRPERERLYRGAAYAIIAAAALSGLPFWNL